jgi:predicted alpha/beta superfamily hydrolase
MSTKRSLSACLLLLIMTTTTSEGKLLVLGPMPSRYLDSARTIRVYLPPSYETDPDARYPVLYLHDGQNVFSSAGPDCCFGWGNWDLDGTADRLIDEGRMREIIMVAVDNSRSRYREYRGRLYSKNEPSRKSTRSSSSVATNALDNTKFDAYVNFLNKELKPRIDREFRTLPGPATTGVMGSSMGGICSLALAWEYPKTFGLAASLSGAFQVEKTNFLGQSLVPYRGKRKPVRVYLDSGVVDYTGDDDGRKHTDAVAAELRRIGWEDGLTLQHYTDLHPLTDSELGPTGLRHDKWHEARTSQHNEFYWRLRAWRALTFLFPSEPPAVNRFRRSKR